MLRNKREQHGQRSTAAHLKKDKKTSAQLVEVVADDHLLVVWDCTWLVDRS
jgi:hypothetical protein